MAKKATYKNFLIIQTSFIGDAILASSLAEKLHTYFPQANISILVRKGNESIYHQHPFLKDVLTWNKSKNKFSNLLRLIFDVRRNKYDCVINCHRFASSGLICAFSGAKHISGFKQHPLSFLFNITVQHKINSGLHETERYNQLVEDFTDTKVFKPKLYPSNLDFESIKPYQVEQYICVAPASVWFTKQLPVKKWIELFTYISPNTKIYLLGAQSDLDLCRSIVKQCGRENIQILAGQLTLLESCALMKNAKMNFTNDSGPLHLASSVNAPVVSFFLSTTPAFGFGPLSDSNYIVENLQLPCRPCGLHGYKSCPKKHFNCALELDFLPHQQHLTA